MGEVRLDDNKIRIFGAWRANVTGLGAREPMSRVWHCQYPSKVAILASARPASGGCWLKYLALFDSVRSSKVSKVKVFMMNEKSNSTELPPLSEAPKTDLQ